MKDEHFTIVFIIYKNIKKENTVMVDVANNPSKRIQFSLIKLKII